MYKASARSADYLRRKNHHLKARFKVFTFIGALFWSLVAISTIEGSVVKFLIQGPASPTNYILFGFLIALFLLVYSLLLSRLIVHILYNLEHAAIAHTITTSATVLVYAFVFYKFKNFQPLTYLALAKLLSIALFFRFWRLQFAESHNRLKSALAPQRFILSWNAFLVCRWVLVACFLLMFLGMALALVSTHPVIDLEGWEGVVIILSFYFVFRAFAQNPNAHGSRVFLS